jgi:hypothetical protein
MKEKEIEQRHESYVGAQARAHRHAQVLNPEAKKREKWARRDKTSESNSTTQRLTLQRDV